jgi:hypothetical protein
VKDTEPQNSSWFCVFYYLFQDREPSPVLNSTWSYEHAQKQALIDAALKLAEEDIDQLSGLVLVP